MGPGRGWLGVRRPEERTKHPTGQGEETSEGNSGMVYLNRRIPNGTYGGVGGRRGRLLLLPDSGYVSFVTLQQCDKLIPHRLERLDLMPIPALFYLTSRLDGFAVY